MASRAETRYTSVEGGKSRYMVTISYQDSLRVAQTFIDIPETPQPSFPSCYAFAFVKSGSVLLNNLIRGLMEIAGLPVIDLPVLCFSKGIAIDTILFELDQIFRPKGYCYAGFRNLPPAMRGVTAGLQGNKLLMVRDPRDMLVSLYYSVKFSHPFPAQATAQFSARMNPVRTCATGSIDQFCLSNVDIYLSTLKEYTELIDDASVKILRYEDVVFDKAGLACTIRDWFSLDISATQLTEVARRFDILPAEDKPHDHIRQVHPGDHKRKLQPATIEILSQIFQPFLQRFDYSI